MKEQSRAFSRDNSTRSTPEPARGTTTNVSNKPTIKIVKRDERRRLAETKKASPKIDPSEQDPTNQARTVTGWVRDFKKKGVKTEKLTATVFEKSLSPNEA